MSSYELSFELVYRPSIAGGAGYRSENFPLWMQIYMSHELRPRRPVTLRFDASDTVQTPRTVSVPMRPRAQESEVYAPLRDAGAYDSFASVGRQFERGSASRSCCLIFNAYGSTMSEDDNAAQTRVGSARISMLQLLALARDERQEISFALVQNTVNTPDEPNRRGPTSVPPLEKGVIRVRNVRISSDGVPVTADKFERRVLLPTQPNVDNETEAQRARIAEIMRDCVARSLRAFSSRRADALLPKPTRPFIAHFHCPEWRMNFMFAPAFAYLGYRAEYPSTRAFFANAARVALRRCAMTLEDATTYGRALLDSGAVGQREHAFVRFVATMITLYATTMPYLDDFTNANRAGVPSRESLIELTEDFKCARVCRADDCEGVAQAALLEAAELAERLEPSDATPVDVLLSVVRSFLRCYVMCLSLHAVTNKKAVPAAHLDVADDAVPAHTICMLIPYAQFERWVSRHLPAERLRGTRFYRSRAGELERAPRNLPIVLVDGTARTDPCVLPLSEYFNAEERASGAYTRAISHLHDKCRLIDRVRRVCTNTRLTNELFATLPELTDAHRRNTADVSDFFKYVVKVQTLATAELGACDFAAVVLPTEAGDNGPGTYGVYFNDFILKSPRIGLVPYLHVTPTEMMHIDMLLASEEFVPGVDCAANAPTKNGAEQLTELRALRRESKTGRRNDDSNDSSTLLHPRIITVAARTQDIGEPELAALRKLASMDEFTRIDVDAFRIADADGVGEATEAVDITFYY